ncbi:hypothetical protein AB0K18_30475 [Nonomuraea sp. NPDC049421]|uniref:hypothetical protein n=1 Tax=Nonomuraea sp. NPDC049421 TaxID=3155275 RepID=UPI00342709CA
MHRLAGALMVMLLSGCTAPVQGDREAAPSTTEPLRPLRTSTTTPLKMRPLADLKERVKGKVVLSYADEKAERSSWTAEARFSNGYVVAVDCVGFEGKLKVITTSGLNFLRKCIDGYTTVTVDNYPRKPLKNHQVTVHAPPGAKWAVLIVRLP